MPGLKSLVNANIGHQLALGVYTRLISSQSNHPYRVPNSWSHALHNRLGQKAKYKHGNQTSSSSASHSRWRVLQYEGATTRCAAVSVDHYDLKPSILGNDMTKWLGTMCWHHPRTHHSLTPRSMSQQHEPPVKVVQAVQYSTDGTCKS